MPYNIGSACCESVSISVASRRLSAYAISRSKIVKLKAASCSDSAPAAWRSVMANASAGGIWWRRGVISESGISVSGSEIGVAAKETHKAGVA